MRPAPLSALSRTRGRLFPMPKWWQLGSKPAVRREEQWRQQVAQMREASDRRRRALHGHEPLVEDIAALLYREDPIVIAFGPDDEYMPEAETIALRLLGLPQAMHLDDVRRVVHETFVQWFGADLAGGPARYDSIAQAVLTSWHRYHPP
jgi:hypothetical protein